MSSINFVNAAYQRYTQVASAKTTVDSTKSFSAAKTNAANCKNSMVKIGRASCRERVCQYV